MKENEYMTNTERLTKLLIERNCSKKNAAEILGVSIRTIYNYCDPEHDSEISEIHLNYLFNRLYSSSG